MYQLLEKHVVFLVILPVMAVQSAPNYFCMMRNEKEMFTLALTQLVHYAHMHNIRKMHLKLYIP